MRRFLVRVLVAYGIIIFALLVYAAANADQPDCVFGSFGCGHEQIHEKSESWQRDSGMSCCHGGDCRPTKIRGNREDGYEWWDGEVWVPAPDAAILKTDVLSDGRAYVCAPRPHLGQGAKDRLTYCLSPSEPKI